MANPLLYYGIPSPIVELPASGPAGIADATLKWTPGALALWKGNWYKYVKFNNGTGNVASAAGGVVHWMAAGLNPLTGLFTVTSDQTDALALLNSVAGIILGVVTDLYWCWVQVGGVAVDCLVDAATVAGDHMIGGTTDLTFGLTAAALAVVGTEFGTALEADTAGKADVLLRNLLW